jgi:hypothetical protein
MRGQQPSTPDLSATRTELRPGGSMTHSMDPLLHGCSRAATLHFPMVPDLREGENEQTR